MEVPGLKVDMDSGEGKDAQRHGASNKGLLGGDGTRTSLFKTCAITAAVVLLLSFMGSVCLTRARETGVQAGGPVAATTLSLKTIPRRRSKNRRFRKLRRLLQGGGADDVVTLPLKIIPEHKRQNRGFRKLRRFLQGGGVDDVATMTMSHDEFEEMRWALQDGDEVRWAVRLNGKRWTGDVKSVLGPWDTPDLETIANSPECQQVETDPPDKWWTLYQYQLTNGFMPPLHDVTFNVHCCGDENQDGRCELSCDCYDLEMLSVAFEGGGEHDLSEDMYWNDAFWFQDDAEAITYDCIVDQGESLNECCPGPVMPDENGLCTLLSCVDATDITIRESCSCHDIKEGCLKMGIFHDMPLCNHMIYCCDADAESLDFNTCIAQLIPEKRGSLEICQSIYGGVHKAFDCEDDIVADIVADSRQLLEVEFLLDQREGQPDPQLESQLETEIHYEQQDYEHGRGLQGKCLRRRNYSRRALSETDLVSDMKLRYAESCLKEEYTLAVQAIGSHLVVLAFPQGGSNCPVVAADSGYTNDSQEVRHTEGVPVLTKHLTLMELDSVTEEDLESMLLIGNVASLTAFHDAIQSARTSASKDSAIHGVVGNCATFILDVMTDLQADFGKKEMQTKITNFVVQALMGSKDKDGIVANIKKNINNQAAKAWVKLRGDKYLVKKYVKTFMKNYNRESD